MLTVTYDIVEQQLALEERSLEEGRERYLRQQERLEEDQGYGDNVSKVIKGCLPLLSSAIASWVENSGKNRGRGKGKAPTALAHLKELDSDLLATLTLSAAFSSLRRNLQLTGCLKGIGKAVEDELWAKALENHDPKLYERLVGRAKRTHGALKYRRKAVRATAAKEGVSLDRWPDDYVVKVAEPLLNCLLQTLPEVFEIYEAYKKKHDKRKYLGLTEAARAYLTDIIDVESWMHPIHKPMIAPPKPWTDIHSGGYYSQAAKLSAPLIKRASGDTLRRVRKAIKDGTMAPALEALNIIQSTPWQINEPMLEIVKWAWDEGLQISKFPSNRYLPREPRPENWDELNDNVKKGWRIRASKVILRNRGIDGERITALQDFEVAKMLKDHERFYLPHNLDFRGRVYAIPHFHNQRSDHIRSLFQFAEAKPLGPGGAYWLAIHVANTGDFDKISKAPFEDRVKWVEDNVDMIKEIARDPRGTVQLWSRADKPFQFVAACLDFAGYLQEGDTYASRIPVSLDGSNSGLQHYSAALRSHEGAYVNLIPQERPADLYQAVADVVIDSMRKDVESGDPLAIKVWQQGVDRKLVKRNVMTFSYSSKLFGFKDQHMKDLMIPLSLKVLEGSLSEHPYDIDGDGGFKAAGYIAKHVWDAVNKLVTQAAQGMRFFQDCAGALAHEAKPVVWFTPVGLPVTHRYEEMLSKQVKVFLYDKAITSVPKDAITTEEGDVFKRINLTMKVKPTKRINKKEARSAIAPNVIHSMDAAHLMLTVLDAYDCDIRSFSLVHDSFGTHAADAESFFHIIRRAFVEMYENYCPFEELREATLQALDDKSRCPDVPEKGSLNLSEVLKSDYAFA